MNDLQAVAIWCHIFVFIVLTQGIAGILASYYPADFYTVNLPNYIGMSVIIIICFTSILSLNLI